jgi:hypothetical protein
VFPARYELNSYIVFRKRLVSKRLKWLLRLLKLYKLSSCRMALNCSCVLSLLILECALFSLIGCRGLTFVLRVGQPFNASGLLGFVYIIPATVFNGDLLFMYIPGSIPGTTRKKIVGL